jgi:alkylhydroperoxidase family enzyme
MPTISPIELATAPEAAVKLLKAVEDQIGQSMNMGRTLAHSPAMLDAYLHFLGGLEHGQLSPVLQTLVSGTVAQEMGGEYMLAAIVELGGRAGLSAKQLQDSRHAKSDDQKTQQALEFSAKVIQEFGHLPAAEVESLRQAGFSDQQIVELIGLIALNVWRNLFNLIAQTSIDFPPVKLDQPLPGAGGEHVSR